MSRFTAALALCLLGPNAWSQVQAPPATLGYPPITFYDLYTRGELERKAIRQSENSSGKSAVSTNRAVAATTVLSATGSGTMAVKLSRGYPEDRRVEAEQLFRELLDKHPKLMKQLNAPTNDMASAVATFIGGSWMAYRNADFPDEHFKPLVGQMRQIIGSNPDFANASNAQKQEMFEQMAILGTLMATTQMALKEKPNPQVAANLKQAAKGYLEQFLKTDAERVQITAQGLVLR